MGATPEIAVVIATRDREARLAFLLESLAGQLEPGRLEVIVVRDGDAPRARGSAPPDLAVREVVEPGRAGPATKRNRGWDAAAAPLVAFTDDDCRAAPGWLAALLAAAAGPDVFLQGQTHPDPEQVHLLHGLARTIEVRSPTGWYETSNMAYPRELLERLGGFDERYDLGGEDTDLAWRAIEAGARPRFVEGALVWHAVLSRTLPVAVAEAVRWRGTPALIARHPGLRQGLHRGHFWSKAHLRLPLALAGLALARRAPLLGTLATLPYLSTRLNWREPHPRRLARGLVTVPVFAVVDAVEIAARLPAAVRHRVAVL